MESSSTTPEVTVRVTEIKVGGLFGLYDHTIRLQRNERITIIHGPNGVGKTLVLKAVAAFFNGNFAALTLIPFDRLEITVDSGDAVLVQRKPVPSKTGQQRYAVEVSLRSASEPDYDLSVPQRIELPEDSTRYASTLARSIPGLQQVGADEFYDSRSGTHLDSEHVIWRFADHPATPPSFRRRLANLEPADVRLFRQAINVFMIETSRLYKVDSSGRAFDNSYSIEDRIVDYAAQLRELIQQTLASYGRNAQRLDQTFPHRLISEAVQPLGMDALKQAIKTLDNTQKELAEFGLLEKPSTIPISDDEPSIEVSKRVALTLFTNDIREKLSVLEPLANRINIFLGSINGKLRNKQIYISKESGLLAKDMLGTTLPLDQLSSGEQHEIVLAFELIFNMPKNSLVLLDEPELSLHVTWQRMFLPELLAISKTVEFDCIIATHSPFIVGSRTDLLTLLDADPDVDMPTDNNDADHRKAERD
ncbi:AAA family ATPase [Stenotrophomonas maltophilia]|uniref:AAA family ATPase n=1 Tax=Stenotrophomonas maltophilia TaxID=40324 RepID=UPI0039C3A2A2